MTYRTFTVAITTLAGTSEMEFVAKDANGAKKQARRHMRDECGHSPRIDGPVSYRARSHGDG